MEQPRGRPRHGVCPPSSDRVLAALNDADRPVGASQLKDRAGLPRRTFFFALECLRRNHIVRAGMSLRDARERYYVPAVPEQHVGATG